MLRSTSSCRRSVRVGGSLADEHPVHVDVVEDRHAEVVRGGVVAFVEDDGEAAQLEVADVADARCDRAGRIGPRRKGEQRNGAAPPHTHETDTGSLYRGGWRVAAEEEGALRARRRVARGDVPPRRARSTVRPAGA